MNKTYAGIRTFCWNNQVVIYPIRERNRWFICAESNKKRTVYRTNELCSGPTFRMTEEHLERIMNCYRHWQKKIIKKQSDV